MLHLEAALSLAKEQTRLGSGGKAGDWHTRLFADWRTVFSYVEGARRKPNQADRIRLAGVLLSAEEHYSNGAVERPLLAMALSDPRQASAPGIWAEVANDFWALSHQLAACGSVAAAEVLDSLRRHDWAALPDSVHDALRSRVAELSATAWHSLKDANSEAAFTQACSSLAARPALLLGLLGRMAAASVRRNLPEGSNVEAALAEVANGLLVLAEGLPAEPVIESLPDWWPLGELPVCAWAARLLREPSAQRTLVDVLARADVRLTELRRAATAEGVEGLAMGTHGALNRELSRGTHAEEWVL